MGESILWEAAEGQEKRGVCPLGRNKVVEGGVDAMIVHIKECV